MSLKVYGNARLGKDAETTGSGDQIRTKMRAAFQPWGKDQEAVWLTVTCSKGTASASEGLKKGDLVTVQGELKAYTPEGKNTVYFISAFLVAKIDERKEPRQQATHDDLADIPF